MHMTSWFLVLGSRFNLLMEITYDKRLSQ
jgi:hypothetical protein